MKNFTEHEKYNTIDELISEYNRTATSRNIRMIYGMLTGYSRRKETCEVSFDAIDIDLYNKIIHAPCNDISCRFAYIAEEAAGLTVTFTVPRTVVDNKECMNGSGLDPKWFVDHCDEYIVARLPLGLPGCDTLGVYSMPDKEALAHLTSRGLIVVGDASNCHIILNDEDD